MEGRARRADDFLVLDNGVAQNAILLDRNETAANVVLVLDRSESVAGDAARALREAVRTFVEGLRPIDYVALLSFHHHVSLDHGFTREHQRVLEALERPHAAGATALYDALYAGLGIASSREGRTALVLLTDGVDTASIALESETRAVLDQMNAVVYVVGSLPSVADMVRGKDRP